MTIADETAGEAAPSTGTSNVRFVMRVFWIVIQLVLVYWLDQQRELFFYQGF
jgi:hypothetical protein